MPLRFTEKSLKEDLVERLGNIISHLSNGYKNLPTLRDEIFRKWNFLQNLEYCSVINWISPLKQIKKNVITGENLGKNQIRILVNKSSIETLKVLSSALSLEPICQTFSNAELTELNRFPGLLAQNKLTSWRKSSVAEVSKYSLRYDKECNRVQHWKLHTRTWPVGVGKFSAMSQLDAMASSFHLEILFPWKSVFKQIIFKLKKWSASNDVIILSIFKTILISKQCRQPYTLIKHVTISQSESLLE